MVRSKLCLCSGGVTSLVTRFGEQRKGKIAEGGSISGTMTIDLRPWHELKSIEPPTLRMRCKLSCDESVGIR